MLVPIYLGLCRASDFDKGHEAAGTLMNANLAMAVLVSVVHATAMSLPADVQRGWFTAISVSNFYRGAGSIWIRLGPSASFWSELLHSGSVATTSPAKAAGGLDGLMLKHTDREPSHVCC